MTDHPTVQMKGGRPLINSTAGFVPCPSAPAKLRGDTGKGPLPKTVCCGGTETRNVRLGGKRGQPKTR